MNLLKQLKELPKVELHLHLDGSVKPETLLEIAQKDGIPLPTTDLDQLKKLLMVSGKCRSLHEYLQKFKYPQLVMQSYDNLERIAYELCAMVAEENVQYFEVRFAPQFHTQRGLTLNQVVEAVLAGLKRGEEDFSLQARTILCGMRHQDPETNLQVVKLAAQYKDQGVVAVDLAGDEKQFPVDDHKEMFGLAEKLGLHVTIHAGEAAGAESVLKSLHYGAERIGHGVRMEESPELVEWVKEHQIPLEICPISNLQTNVVAQIKDHPVKDYFDQGVRVTINTDNRTVSSTSLVKEYLLLMKELDFTIAEIKQMVLYAAQSAFIPKKEKEILIKNLKQKF